MAPVINRSWATFCFFGTRSRTALQIALLLDQLDLAVSVLMRETRRRARPRRRVLANQTQPKRSYVALLTSLASVGASLPTSATSPRRKPFRRGDVQAREQHAAQESEEQEQGGDAREPRERTRPPLQSGRRCFAHQRPKGEKCCITSQTSRRAQGRDAGDLFVAALVLP